MSIRTVGTNLYIPPEILQGRKYSLEKAQVWELGVTFYYLLVGYLPVQKMDRIQYSRSLLEKALMIRNKSKDEAKFLGSMLSMEPDSRPTLNDIIEFLTAV